MSRTILVAATVDASYLDYLAVAVHSASERLPPEWRLRVFVIGYALDEAAKRGFEQRVGERVAVEWPTLRLNAVEGRWRDAVAGGVTLYYRLFLGEALPAFVERVLFLDADTLALGNLVELWESPFDGAVVQAVPDAYAHTAHTPRLRRLALADGPRFDDTTPYFNAGVLLIDLAQWRAENVGGRAAAFLWTHSAVLSGRDQDALNCALVGRWKPLSAAWNFHELPAALDSWRAEADSPASRREAILRPRIVHFIGCNPWQADCLHFYRRRWRRAAREAGLEPPRESFGFRLLRAPLYDFHWRLQRGVRQAGALAQAGRAALLLLARPWLAAAYPLWLLRRSVRRRRRRQER